MESGGRTATKIRTAAASRAMIIHTVRSGKRSNLASLQVHTIQADKGESRDQRIPQVVMCANRQEELRRVEECGKVTAAIECLGLGKSQETHPEK